MTRSTFAVALALTISSVAGAQTSRVTVRTENPLAIARREETVVISWAELQRRLTGASAEQVRVLDAEGRELASQVVDDDGDGTLDALIFQSGFDAKESRRFTIEGAAPTGKHAPRVHIRYDVPRDDVAWENDRTAYRIYGEGLKKTASAMSSAGIDVWNKKTRALILEKWYTAGHDAYHVDKGEGADFYDVGTTLGNGGVAAWKNDTIWRPDNFKRWRMIANGPVRAIFELSYDPFDAAGTKISETKRIAIDAGSNLYRATSVFTTPGGGRIPYVTGTVKRPGMIGTMSRTHNWAWLTGWGPVAPKNGGHGEMGTAVLLPRASLTDWKEAVNHYLAVSFATSGTPVTHYVGSAWTASGDFPTPQAWWRYLDEMAQRIDAPVKVTFDAPK